MPPQTPATCTHELRPGITVCLHCRYAAREASAARTRALALRAGAAVVVLLVAGAGAVAMLRGDGSPSAAPVAAAASDAPPDPTPAEPMVESMDPRPVPVTTVASVAAPIAPPAPALAPAPRGALRIGPVIPEGRTALRGGVVAMRSGDTVTVLFDTPETRTRRRDKFERVVRTTLPAVFGPAADSALAAVPSGRLIGGGDLLTELPRRGVRLATPYGTLALWPTTRAGRDGPLVVTYVATFVR